MLCISLWHFPMWILPYLSSIRGYQHVTCAGQECPLPAHICALFETSLNWHLFAMWFLVSSLWHIYSPLFGSSSEAHQACLVSCHVKWEGSIDFVNIFFYLWHWSFLLCLWPQWIWVTFIFTILWSLVIDMITLAIDYQPDNQLQTRFSTEILRSILPRIPS